MTNLKVVLAICILCLSVAADPAEDPSSEELSEETFVASSEELSEEERSVEYPDVKVNWGPVWDDIEGDNEFVYRTEDSEEEEHCIAPNGLGLNNLLKQINRLLPWEKIKQKVISYTPDPEIKSLRAALKNPVLREKMAAAENTKEYRMLKDYSCRILHMDLENYQQLVRSLTNPSFERVQERKGIKGLITAIEALIPHEEIRQLYDDLLQTDYELSEAVDHLKSKEFIQLLKNVNSIPEYQEIRKQFIKLGVPVDDKRDLIAHTLGWTHNFDILH